MEGLEVTVLSLSQVREENRVFRYDTQYFNKTALAAENLIKSRQWARLIDISDNVESFGAYALTNEFDYVNEGIPFLRCVNIRNGFADFGDVLFVDEKANALLSKSEVKPNMVLLTMSGSVGNATVALESWKYPINSNQDIAKISPKTDVSPFYLVAFLGSRYGQVQMERLPVGSVQQHIFLWMIEQLVVARFSQDVEQVVSNCVNLAFRTEAKCRTLQAQAEQTLLRALDLEDWAPPEPLTYTRRASEVFSDGRIDAEFHRPVVVALKHILSQRFPLKMLSELGIVDNGQTVPYDAGGDVPIIRSGDLSDIEDDTRFLRARSDTPIYKLERGDVLVSSIGFGSIGKIQIFDKPGTYGTVSEVTVIRQNEVNPYFLASFLRSRFGQMQIERYITGATGQLHLYKRDVRNIFIPIIPPAVQTIFEQLACDAVASRAKATSLLAKAKRAVEIAIEESESAAIKYLKNN